MVSYFRRQTTLGLSILGILVIAVTFALLATIQAPLRSVEVGVAEQSPLGHAGGVVVPASCPSYDHNTGGQCGPCQAGYDYDMNGNCVSTTVPDPTSPPGNPHYLLDQPIMNGPVCNVAGNQATFSWGAVPNAEVYAFRLDNSTNNNASCVDGWHCNTSQDHIIDTLTATTYVYNLVPGAKYFWWVHAKYADSWAGTSGYTKLELICMAPPASMTATCDASGTSATLSWSSSNGALQYQGRLQSSVPITQAQCPSGWSLFTDGRTCVNNDLTSTSVVVPVVAGRTYDAWVHSEGDNGWSSDATHIPGSAFTCTAPTAPAAPASMTASCGSGGTSMNLSWPTVSGATSYALRYSKASMSSCPAGWTLVGGTTCAIDGYTGGQPVNVPITANTTYDAWIHAVNAAGGSAATHIPGSAISCSSGTPAPTCTISASPTTVTSGGTSVLTKSSTNATSATLNGVSTATSGTTNVNPTVTTTYTMSVSGAGGTGSCSTTVTVSAAGALGINCTQPSITAGASTVAGQVTGGASGTDWVGVFAAGAADSAYSAWAYAPLPRPANVSLSAPAAPGNYQLRVFQSNGSVAAAACNFTVTAPAQPTQISVTNSQTAGGQTVYTAPQPDVNTGGWVPIPKTHNPVTAGGHWIFFSDVAGYVATVGTCTGTSCTPSTYDWPAGCSGGQCWAWVTATANQTTRLDIKYTAPPTEPATVSATCNSGGASMNLSWTAAPGATYYNPRFYKPSMGSCPAGWTLWTDGATCYIDGFSGTAINNIPISPNTTYDAWVQSGNIAGGSAGATHIPGNAISCPSSGGTISVSRVGSGGTTASAPAGTTAAVDGGTASSANPASFTSVSVGSHSVAVTDVAGYTEMVGTCTGASCTPGSYSISPTCNGTTCTVTGISVSAGVTTGVSVQYTAAPTTGTIQVTRTGASGTTASVDGGTASSANPASFANVSTGTHSVSFTDVAGYTEMVGTCSGASCTPSSYGTTPSCNGTLCTVTGISVSANTTTGVGVQYTAVSSGPISCLQATVTPGGTITGRVTGGGSTQDWVSVYTPGSPTAMYGATDASPSYRYVPLPRPQDVSFSAPTTPGNYELRVQYNNSTVTAGSCPFTVTSSCTPAPTSPETRQVACPSGQTGIITEQRNSTCPGPTWSAWGQVSSTCTPAVTPTLSITSSATTVQSGEMVTITWSSTNTTSCTVTGPGANFSGTSGNQSVGPITSRSVFTLSCQGPAGTFTQGVVVNIVPIFNEQ